VEEKKIGEEVKHEHLIEQRPRVGTVNDYADRSQSSKSQQSINNEELANDQPLSSGDDIEIPEDEGRANQPIASKINDNANAEQILFKLSKQST